MVYPETVAGGARRAAGYLVLFLAAGVASAQIYPGGYPGSGYPGGGYPGGYPGGGYPGSYPGGYPTGYPGTGGTTSIPGPTRGSQPTTNRNAPLPNFRGKLRLIDSKSITLALDDDRIIEFKRTGSTHFFKNGDEVKSPVDFRPGDQVSVEGPEDMAGNMTAVNVYWEKAGSSGGTRTTDRDSTPDTWATDAGKPTLADADKPTTAVAPPASPSATDDPDRPVLHRGGAADPSREQSAAVPAQTSDDPDRPVLLRPQSAPVPAQPPEDPDRPVLRRTQSSPDQSQPTAVASATLPPVNPLDSRDDTPAPRRTINRDDQDLPFGSNQQDPLVRRAANAAMDFTETLPNYVCQEVVTRYVSQTSPASWQAQDIVTSEVVYENGKEDYRNITVGGRPFHGSMEETGGSWSEGEFGTILINLFNPGTAAEFHYLQDSRVNGVNAKKYSLEVTHANSHWSVTMDAQQYTPGYTGNVWIDPATGRVLRIEMFAHNFPGGFPTDHVESATDYEYVRLGGTEQFLLPTHSETLSCQRGSSLCSKNTIDFRNYRKFEGQSTVTFGDAK
jgi:hypothetical protein